jgi:hypothetical protein
MLDPLSLSVPLATPQGDREPLPVRKLLYPSPEHLDDYIMELDYSSLSKFMECPRQFENYAIRGREANRDRSATDFGKLFHTLEEQRRRETFSPEVRAKQLATIEEHFLHHPVPVGDHRTSDRMVQVTDLYYQKFAKDGLEKKVFHDADGPFIERPYKIELATVEVNAELPYEAEDLTNDDIAIERAGRRFYIRNLHILATGRIDLVVEEAGMLWVLDDKTTSRGGKQFAGWFRLSNQTRGYCWAVQKITNRPVAGCIVNAEIVRPLTKSGVGTEFDRLTYFYSEDLISEWEDNAKATVQDIVSSLVRGYFPQYARSFISPCDNCDYNDNCPLPKSQRAADLASDLYRDVTWSPMHE